MRVGVGPGFEHLGAELVAHVDVVVQVDVHDACAGDPLGHLQHPRAVGGEMQVGAPDSARTYADQHLSGAGPRIRHVVPVDHPAV